MWRKICTWSCFKAVCAENIKQIHTSCRTFGDKPPLNRKYLSRMLFKASSPKESNRDAVGKTQCKSQLLLMNNELISGCHTGSFYFLPNALRALEKLIRLIDKELQEIGCQKISMPTLISAGLWHQTGRWDTPELFKLKDRHSKEFCLGPTHEELVTTLFANQEVSHRRLPVMLYQLFQLVRSYSKTSKQCSVERGFNVCAKCINQVTRKFRDEKRPRYGLLRSREFDMKDLYTFDTDLENAANTYDLVCKTYTKVFDRLGLNFIKCEGDTGNIGGKSSHEFHLPADIGEDVIYHCTRCGFAANKELIDVNTIKEDQSIDRPKCNCNIPAQNAIEVGHAFLLGTKYSSVFNASYKNEAGNQVLAEMGCYGLGVTRILQAAVEVLSQDNNIVWPSLIAPYQVCIIPNLDRKNEYGYPEMADNLYDNLNRMPNLRGEIVIFDSDKSTIGSRVSMAKQHGYPYIIVVGKKALESPALYEVLKTRTNETEYLSTDQLLHMMATVETL